MSLELQFFREAGDGEGAGEVLDVLGKISRGPDPDDFWRVVAVFRAQKKKDQERAILDRCVKRLEARVANLRAGKTEPIETDFRRTSATDPAERLPIAVAELAETHVLLGNRAAAETVINSLTDLAQLDSARGQWAVFRVQADDPSTALELLKTIQDPTRRDEATIDAALQLKIKK